MNDEEMYRMMRKGWVSGRREGTECGANSTAENARNASSAITEVVQSYNIKSIADVGCGDMNWITGTNLAGSEYTGYDLIPRVDGVVPFDVSKDILPDVDLVICRDVFLHLDEPRVKAALSMFKGCCKYALISQFPKSNNTIGKMGLSHWNLAIEPYSLGAPIKSWRETRSARMTLGLWRMKYD